MSTIKKLWLLGMGFCLAVSCTHTETTDTTTAEEGSLIQVGGSLPAFSVTTDDGTVMSNVSLKGYVTVLVFFHTGCGDCQKELPQVDSLYRAFRENPKFRLLGISREETAQEVAAYWTSAGLIFPYAAQSDRTVYHLFAREGIPRIYISDTGGQVRFLSSDIDMPDVNTLSTVVNGLLMP